MHTWWNNNTYMDIFLSLSRHSLPLFFLLLNSKTNERTNNHSAVRVHIMAIISIDFPFCFPNRFRKNEKKNNNDDLHENSKLNLFYESEQDSRTSNSI